jgi:DNA-binding response OmpR family regulator
MSTSTAPILLVESDASRARQIAEQLTADGYGVELAPSAAHARALIRRNAPALAVLGNLNGPHGALGLLQEIRRAERGPHTWNPMLPTIVMGPDQNEMDVLRAFEAGADDFASPDRYLELRARLQALLRRDRSGRGGAPVLEVGTLEVDTRTHTARLSGRAVDLRRLEFDLLLHLAGDPERVFSKAELLRAVWGYRSACTTRTLDSHASRLRRKLDADHPSRWVVNVWGVGYRLT